MPQDFLKALKATKLRDGDELVSVDICDGDKGEVIMVTKEGFITRYDANEISLFAPNFIWCKGVRNEK